MIVVYLYYCVCCFVELCALCHAPFISTTHPLSIFYVVTRVFFNTLVCLLFVCIVLLFAVAFTRTLFSFCFACSSGSHCTHFLFELYLLLLFVVCLFIHTLHSILICCACILSRIDYLLVVCFHYTHSFYISFIAL